MSVPPCRWSIRLARIILRVSPAVANHCQSALLGPRDCQFELLPLGMAPSINQTSQVPSPDAPAVANLVQSAVLGPRNGHFELVPCSLRASANASRPESRKSDFLSLPWRLQNPYFHLWFVNVLVRDDRKQFMSVYPCRWRSHLARNILVVSQHRQSSPKCLAGPAKLSV